MRVQISDQALLPDLLDFLRRVECVADVAGRDLLEVEVPRAPDERQARRELDLYVRAWQAMHPEADARIHD